MFRVWNSNGECVHSTPFTESDQISPSHSEETKFSINASIEDKVGIKVYIQIGNRIYRSTLKEKENNDLQLEYNGSVIVPSGEPLNSYQIFGNIYWAECEDEEGNEVIKVVDIPKDGSVNSWTDVTPLRTPPEDYSFLNAKISNLLLQSDLISEFAC